MNGKLRKTLKAWPAIAAATIGLCFLTRLAADALGHPLPDQDQVRQVVALLRHAFDSWRLLAASAIVVAQVLLMAPLLEEPVFRGLAWGLPTKRGRRGGYAVVIAAAIVSSAAFSAVHYIDFQALFNGRGFGFLPLSDAFLGLFFFGLAQCWLYARTERIWCPMLNHFLFNLTNLVLVLVIPESWFQ